MADGFDFLHLKRLSAGSPNELSFDVLDAASRELDEQSKRKRSRQSSSDRFRQSNGSLPASTATLPDGGSTKGGHARRSTYEGAPEVQRRKKARRARSLRMRVIGAVVLIVVLCGCVLVSHGYYQNHMDVTARIDELISRFVKVDNSIVAIDTLMREPFNTAGVEGRAEALEAMDGLDRELEAIADEARSLSTVEGAQAVSVTIDDVVAAAESREALLDAAKDAFELSADINVEVGAINDIWMQVLDADQQTRSASEDASRASTVEETRSARDATAGARDLFADALESLEGLSSDAGELDLTPQQDYLQKRIEALDYALQTSDALLNLDDAAAVIANERYNEVEREAANLASALPTSPGDAVLALYEAQMTQAHESYMNAREALSGVDSRLRERLPY